MKTEIVERSDYWDKQVELAKIIATRAHEGQTRKDNVTPYIIHPETVAYLTKNKASECMAWLHDVLEDTCITPEELLSNGVDPIVIAGLSYLTHRDQDTYFEYIRMIRDSGNTLAKEVKIADLCSNLSTLDSIPSESDKLFLLKRYTKALKIFAGIEE